MCTPFNILGFIILMVLIGLSIGKVVNYDGQSGQVLEEFNSDGSAGSPIGMFVDQYEDGFIFVRSDGYIKEFLFGNPFDGNEFQSGQKLSCSFRN